MNVFVAGHFLKTYEYANKKSPKSAKELYSCLQKIALVLFILVYFRHVTNQ